MVVARLHNSLPPMQVLLNMCSGHAVGMVSDFETVLEALRVLSNCVGAGAVGAMAERGTFVSGAKSMDQEVLRGRRDTLNTVLIGEASWFTWASSCVGV